MKLLASAWSAPAWMKNNKRYTGYTMLNMKNGRVYAEYLRKFLDEYEKKGVSIWGISTGANPINGFYGRPNSMGWIPDLQVRIKLTIS